MSDRTYSRGIFVEGRKHTICKHIFEHTHTHWNTNHKLCLGEKSKHANTSKHNRRGGWSQGHKGEPLCGEPQTGIQESRLGELEPPGGELFSLHSNDNNINSSYNNTHKCTQPASNTTDGDKQTPATTTTTTIQPTKT